MHNFLFSSLHLLTAPLIIPSTLEHVMPVTMAINPAAAQAIKKENLMQGA